MSFIDVLGRLFKVFVNDESVAWNRNFYKNVLPEINKEYDLIKNEDGSNFAKYIQDMKESVLNGVKTLDALLPRVFAIVKKAMGLTLKIEHFDVQLLGATVLHAGKIAEMKTGEGKTYITPLAAVLNCLDGNKVIIMTSNDYLAKRDANILKPLYDLLGVSVGFITDNMDSQSKYENYQADIIHVSNSGVVFDYLRDRLVLRAEEKMQPPYHFCIVDEVDSCLIDGSRTPLIISGTSKETTSHLYASIANIIKQIEVSHYVIISEKAILTNEGLMFVESELKKNNVNINIYERQHIGIFNIITNLLHAHIILKKGKDYIVTNNEILLIDQYTHRTSEGRRFSHGLHQAIEAIEGVPIKDDNIVSASTTYFTYATLFKKIGGMSGTCTQERNEFIDLYNLHIIQIPTNRPLIRKDHSYVSLFRNKDIMYNYVAKMIQDSNPDRRILICTPSVYESELLHEVLEMYDIKHSLLNAKYPKAEVATIEKAGLPGNITLTTGMAGRGTDILLGGSVSAAIKHHSEALKNGSITEEQIRLNIQEQKEKVLKAGGLLVLVVGLFESKKTEDQIRGRGGRQGEPGETFVFCSRDDDLIKMSLPQEASGFVESIANSINFINDKDVISDREVTEMVREIQMVYQLNGAEVRKNQAKLSNNAQSISIPGQAGNYHYRDLILNCNNLKQFHFNLIDKVIKSIKYTDILDLISQLGNKIFKEVPNPILECSSIEEIYSDITQKLDIYYDNEDQGLILYTYDKCYEKFMLLEDGARRTVNTIVYGHMDPATEFERIIFDLLKVTMQDFMNKAMLYLYYPVNIERKGGCSPMGCDIPAAAEMASDQLPNMSDIQEMFKNIQNNDSISDIMDLFNVKITYSEYLKNTTDIIDIYAYLIQLFISQLSNNIEHIKQYIIELIQNEAQMAIETDDTIHQINTIQELEIYMLDKMNIITHNPQNDHNILYHIYIHTYDDADIINSPHSIDSLQEFKNTTSNHFNELMAFIQNTIIILFIFDK